LFSAPTIGHLGFTGTSFWLELATGVHIVMLTNRTHPYRFTEGIRTARPVIHDALMAAVKRASDSLFTQSGV
jgi:CubicO group peptidase (beta-lactamase class C family)